LYKGYRLLSIRNKKLGQQYAGPFKVTERVGLLAYRLDILINWKVHSIFSVAQLEPVLAPEDDLYSRLRPDQPEAIIIDSEPE
jgi:hypothetical protein